MNGDEKETSATVTVADQNLRRLMANVAHDLKTPLVAMTNSNHLAITILNDVRSYLHANAMIPDSVLQDIELAQSMLEGTVKMTQFMKMSINRCMDFSKFNEDVKLKPSMGTINVSETLKLPMECMVAVDSNQRIEMLALPVDMCSHIITDQQWLQENVLCLASNASKYSSKGKITLGISLCNLEEVLKRPHRSNATMFGSSSTHSSPRPNSSSPALNDPSGSFAAIGELPSPSHVTGGVGIFPPVLPPPPPNTPSYTTQHGGGGGGLTAAALAGVGVADGSPRGGESVSDLSSPSPSMMPRLPSNSTSSKGGGAAVFDSSVSTPPLNLKQRMVVVECEDTGIGLSEEAMSNLFAPFKQAQRLAGGTGLGLFSLSNRMSAMNGYCGVSGRRDGKQGSLFWFAFPYKPDFGAAEAFLEPLTAENLARASQQQKMHESHFHAHHRAQGSGGPGGNAQWVTRTGGAAVEGIVASCDSGDGTDPYHQHQQQSGPMHYYGNHGVDDGYKYSATPYVHPTPMTEVSKLTSEDDDPQTGFPQDYFSTNAPFPSYKRQVSREKLLSFSNNALTTGAGISQHHPPLSVNTGTWSSRESHSNRTPTGYSGADGGAGGGHHNPHMMYSSSGSGKTSHSARSLMAGFGSSGGTGISPAHSHSVHASPAQVVRSYYHIQQQQQAQHATAVPPGTVVAGTDAGAATAAAAGPPPPEGGSILPLTMPPSAPHYKQTLPTPTAASGPDRSGVSRTLSTSSMHVTVAPNEDGKLSILLVDDTPSILKICCRMLQREGYSVVTAENGLEALKILKNQSFDVVLMDLYMPVLDGLETVKRLRGIETDLQVNATSQALDRQVQVAANTAQALAQAASALANHTDPFSQSIGSIHSAHSLAAEAAAVAAAGNAALVSTANSAAPVCVSSPPPLIAATSSGSATTQVEGGTAELEAEVSPTAPTDPYSGSSKKAADSSAAAEEKVLVGHSRSTDGECANSVAVNSSSSNVRLSSATMGSFDEECVARDSSMKETHTTRESRERTWTGGSVSITGTGIASGSSTAGEGAQSHSGSAKITASSPRQRLQGSHAAHLMRAVELGPARQSSFAGLNSSYSSPAAGGEGDCAKEDDICTSVMVREGMQPLNLVGGGVAGFHASSLDFSVSDVGALSPTAHAAAYQAQHRHRSHSILSGDTNEGSTASSVMPELNNLASQSVRARAMLEESGEVCSNPSCRASPLPVVPEEREEEAIGIIHDNSLPLQPIKCVSPVNAIASGAAGHPPLSPMPVRAVSGDAQLGGLLTGHQTLGSPSPSSATSGPLLRQFVVAVSANSDRDIISEAINSGFDAFIEKPFTIHQFLTVISDHINNGGTAASGGGGQTGGTVGTESVRNSLTI